METREKNIKPDRLYRCLSGAEYPSYKNELIKYAQDTCGDSEVISMLMDMPEKDYKDASDLTQVLGGILGKDVDLTLE